MRVKRSTMPEGSLAAAYMPADYSDVYAVEAEGEKSFTPDDIMVSFWTGSVAWVRALFVLRDFLVRFVGLKTGGGQRDGSLETAIRTGGSWGDGLMSIAAKNTDETVMLLSDKHLDAWLSIHIADGVRRRTVSAITVVRFHNTLGRAYLFAIKPFHALIVKTLLRGSVRKFIK